MNTTDFEIVLCIPGMWKDSRDLVTQIVKLSGGYLLAGRVLMNMETQASFELQVETPDPRMDHAFRSAGLHWAETAEMKRIKDHTMVTYLIGKGGSRKLAESIMHAAAALIYSGGLGVKVETSGFAHNPAYWIKLTDIAYLTGAHDAFVLYVTGDEIYSCGMHNFGLPDAIVESRSSENPIELIRTFTRYLLFESPVIREGETFGEADASPRYKLSKEPSELYEPGHLFRNPYGLWRLTLFKKN